MSEENQEPTGEENQEVSAEKDQQPAGEEWEAPPLPEEIEKPESEEPEMSEIGTIFNIFLEPGKTFLDLRKKPRFIIAAVITAILSTVLVIGVQQKLGDDRIRRFITTQAEQNPQFANLPEDQKKTTIDLQLTISKIAGYAFPVVAIIIFLIGAIFYWVGNKVLGGSGSYLQALSVWIYSSFPPTVVGSVLNFIVLLLKNADDIDIANSQRGLISANPTAFFDGKSMPVLTTLISTIDVFVIWGIVLAVIGLQKTMRMSAGSAWGVVLFITLMSVAFRVVSAFFNGVPQ